MTSEAKSVATRSHPESQIPIWDSWHGENLPAIDTERGMCRSSGHRSSRWGIARCWNRIGALRELVGTKVTARYTLVLYAEASGKEPLADFLDGLEPHKRAALIAALSEILARQGLDVCATEYGKHLGGGLAEFRLRHSYDEIVRRFPGGRVLGPSVRDRRGSVLLRVFFHAYGDKHVLLLGGYDKGRRPSKKKQEAEIVRARKRLREFKSRNR